MSKELQKLIEDLILAVTDACWTNDKGKPKLCEPTPHMKRAIMNVEAEIYPRCPTCMRRLT